MTLYSSIQLFCYHVSTYHLNACKLDCTRHAHACAHYTNYLQCTPVRVWVRDYYWTLIRKMPYIPKLTLTQANKLLHYIEKTELQQKSCSFATGKKKKGNKYFDSNLAKGARSIGPGGLSVAFTDTLR